MCPQRRALAVGLLALGVLCMLWAPPAGAHSGDRGLEPARVAELPAVDGALLSPPAEPAPSAPPAVVPPAAIPPTAAAVLLGILVLGLGASRWPAMTVRVLLALLLLGVGVESAVHSVHHLDNPQSGANCQILTITQQLHGDTSPELPSGALVLTFRSHTVAAVPHDTAQSGRRPDEGRAPPRPLA